MGGKGRKITPRSANRTQEVRLRWVLETQRVYKTKNKIVADLGSQKRAKWASSEGPVQMSCRESRVTADVCFGSDSCNGAPH